MSYVPGFSYDLFISYASEDNADAWVERFQEQLTGELIGLLGRPFSEKTVFFDKLRLNVGQAYPTVLDGAARDSAVFVALLSPNYVTSDWCNRERHQFQQRLPRGLSFAECLAAVLVRPTGPLPQILSDAQHKGFVAEGAQKPWASGSRKFKENIDQLAVGIRNVLRKLRKCAGGVFVGATLSSDLHLRERFADYLSGQHFRATPDPLALLDDRAESQKALADAACAVHFIGGASDSALEAIDDSIQHCKGPTVVFQPFGATLTASEELFLSSLPRDRYPHRPGPNETELKKFLEELLAKAGKPAERRPAALSLVCEPADFAWAEQFRAEGLTVDYPKFLLEKRTTMEQVRSWQRIVRESHGLLFYQGQSGDELLDKIQKLADGEHSNAVRRWYLDEPDLEGKKQKRPAAPAYDAGLAIFLDEVRRAAGGAA
jgi:hypothetical protein